LKSAAGPVMAVWGSLLLYSFSHAPVPGVNEPHYLTKARHYWNPDWCQGDFFLESSNPHQFFYQTVGLLTQFLTLAETAVAGRLIAYLLLAAGWHRLARRMTGDRWSGLVAAWVFLLLTSIGNLSGEWLVGGVESKVFSYAFCLLALSALSDSRWPSAGLYQGLAIAFHPLAGMWHLVAASMAAVGGFVVRWWSRRRRTGQIARPPESWGGPLTLRTHRRPTATVILSSLLLLAATGAQGIVPALNAISGVSARDAYVSNYIQVFYRLPHHLDPMNFSSAAWWGYGVLAVVALLLSRCVHPGRTAQLLMWVTWCAGVIALVGLIVGWKAQPEPGVRLSQGDLAVLKVRVALLKFYSFRLFDLLLPVLVSFQVAELCSERRLMSVLMSRPFKVGGLSTLAAVSLWLSSGTGSPTEFTPRQEHEWHAACHWIRDNTPESALFLTPKSQWTFRWLTARPEYVTIKDCPQDARGIIEWNNRLKLLTAWGDRHFTPEGFSRAAAADLHARTGIDYVIAYRLGPFDAPVVYRNDTWTVYLIGASP